MLEVVEEHDVGALSRRDHAAVAQAEGVRGAERGGAVDRERRAAERDRASGS